MTLVPSRLSFAKQRWYIAVLVHRVLLHIVLYIALLLNVLSAGARGTTLGTIIWSTIVCSMGYGACSLFSFIRVCVAPGAGCMSRVGYRS